MMIPETRETSKIVYLYVKSFTHIDVFEKERVGGHPIPNKIYRAVYNFNTKSYKIIINDDPVQAVLIEKLISNDESRGFISEICELTNTNILDFKLEETDLDLLLKWMESDNEDLWGIPEEKGPLLEATIKAFEGIQKFQQDEEKDIRYAIQVLTDLRNINTTQFKILLQLAEVLLEDNMFVHEDPAYQLTLSPDNAGLGLNIGKALRALQAYASPNRRTGGHPDDLTDAVVALITEFERRLINNIE